MRPGTINQWGGPPPPRFLLTGFPIAAPQPGRPALGDGRRARIGVGGSDRRVRPRAVLRRGGPPESRELYFAGARRPFARATRHPLATSSPRSAAATASCGPHWSMPRGTLGRRLRDALAAAGTPPKPMAALILATPRATTTRGCSSSALPHIAGGHTAREPGALGRHAGERLMHPPGPLGYAYQLYATAGWSSLPWLHRVSRPALVIAGEDDPGVPLRNGCALAARLPNARLHVVKGAGTCSCSTSPGAPRGHPGLPGRALTRPSSRRTAMTAAGRCSSMSRRAIAGCDWWATKAPSSVASQNRAR